MGCSGSKAAESPPVVLCRERRELIRAAADSRYALAAAHAAYFRSLAAVGDALQRFAMAEVSVATSSSVLTLPPSSGVKGNSSSAAAAGGDGGDSSSSIGSVRMLSHSVSSEDSHLKLSSEDSHLKLSPEDSHLKLSPETDTERGESSLTSPPPRASSAVPSPKFYFNYMKSTAIPSVVYEEPYPGAWAGSTYPPGYGNEFYGNPLYGVPTGSPRATGDDAYGYDRPASRAAATPPLPPPAQGSTFDFFNLFDSYNQYMPEYYWRGSAVSSPRSSEVREQEGIPDLEDEMDPEPMKKATKERERHSGQKKVEGEVVDADMDSTGGSSKSVPVQEYGRKDDEAISQEKEGKSGSAGSKSKGNGVGSRKSNGEEEGSSKKKGVSLEDMSLITEESGPSFNTALSIHGTRDVMDAVEEIREQFCLAAGCGQELSTLLEVGKVNYRSMNKILRVISSRIVDPMTLCFYTSSHPSFKHQRHLPGSIRNKSTYVSGLQKHAAARPANLSSTLERLYAWEKKLYMEVKEEEKLRVIFDRTYKRLKNLDARGEEFDKIDRKWAALRRLQTKISTLIKSMNTISLRIHKLRDEELQPQLIELIQGFMRMWKSVLSCHQKQFQAIVDSKSHDVRAKIGTVRSSAVKATIELELELLNWCSCFTKWISTQKAYTNTLNGWLIKWLPQEEEVTPDGIAPFSPGRIGAPPVFIVSADWNNSMERISEDEVTRAMCMFANNIHKLWESQDEEQHQNLKVEFLSKDLARRLKTLQKEMALDGHLEIVSSSDNNHAYVDERMMTLDPIKKISDEKRANHEETVKQVKDAASSSLRAGLTPIFQALGNFTLETLKAYNDFRIPSRKEGT